MNGNFFSNPTFPTNESEVNLLPKEINYPVSWKDNRKNILKLNKGKKVKAYFSYPKGNDGQKEYDGIIEDAFNDYLLMSDPKTGEWYLLKVHYLNYVVFEEKINY